MDSQLSLFNGIGQTQAEKKIFDLIGGRMNRQDKGRDSVSLLLAACSNGN